MLGVDRRDVCPQPLACGGADRVQDQVGLKLTPGLVQLIEGKLPDVVRVVITGQAGR